MRRRLYGVEKNEKKMANQKKRNKEKIRRGNARVDLKSRDSPIDNVLLLLLLL